MLRRACTLAALAAAALAPSVAAAANGNMPRTPALFPPHACLTVVDRTVDPTLHFAVHIPFEDTALTEDELADSRTFSFFGLCREPGALEVLPNWIAQDDVDRALAAGVIEEAPPDAVLLDDPAWAIGHDGADKCVQDLTGERSPIACAAIEDGVLWDTTNVPAGNYVVRGYTFAPPSNLWTVRSGVVQVNDGALLPVATLVSPMFDAQRAFVDDGYRVLGCMDGPVGTTVTLQWASTFSDDLGDDAAWTTFAELDAAEQVIDLRFMMPAETESLGLVLRAVARGSDGATWIGQASGFLTVYAGDGTSDDPEVSAPPDHCMAGGDTSGGFGDGDTTSGSGGSSGESSTTAANDDDGGGCGCTHTRRSPWALLLLPALRRRRARRSLVTIAESRDRLVEAERARAKNLVRFGAWR